MITTFTSLNEKGFAISLQEDGSSVECIGVLPGETAEVEIWKKKKQTKKANLLSLITPSPHRIKPNEEAYTATAPLAIAEYSWEQQYKKEWIGEQFTQHGIVLSNFDLISPENPYNYRNKIEFSFYSQDDQLFLAFHKRNTSKGKLLVTQTQLALPSINTTAQKILQFLRTKNYTSWDLKSLIIRAQTDGKTVAAIFCKEKEKYPTQEDLHHLLDDTIQGIVWVYSDHRAPDSRITQLQLSVGITDLQETLANTRLNYPWHGFFQINPPLCTHTLEDIQEYLLQKTPASHQWNVLDLYAGVGTLGITLSPSFFSVHGVEISEESEKYALYNAKQNQLKRYTFQQIAAEKLDDALFYNKDCIIVDPPRSGLMPYVVNNLLKSKADSIIYLSCNPTTQARDCKLLLESYNIDYVRAYNYYPRTMHCENLIILKKQ